MLRKLLLAGVALAALALAGLWLLHSRDRVVTNPVERSGSPTPVEAPVETALDVPATDNRASAAPSDIPPEWTPTPEELATALWIEGRVEFPAGHPSGEVVTLEAQGKAFSKGVRHRVRLGTDGAFRIAFPASSTKGGLHLAGRFVWLDDPNLVLPCTTCPLLLQPELRGCLKGRITLAPASESRRNALAGLRISCWSHDWINSKAHSGPTPNAKLDAHGEFLIEGMPAAADWELSSYAGEFTRIHRTGIGIELGKETHVEIPAQLSAVLRGVVVDEAGAPVAGVKFEHDVGDSDSPGATRLAQKSGPDGTFECKGVPVGATSLLASRSGFLSKTTRFDPLVEGQVVEKLRIELQRGKALTGIVRGPDGAPAAGAHLIAYYSEDVGVGGVQKKRARTASASSSSDGRFRIEGVPAVEMRVEASLTEGPSTWNAFLELDVPPIGEIELRLATACSIRGRVIDPSGAPVESFSISSRPLWKLGPGSEMPSVRTPERFTSKDGSFVVDGCFATSYEVSADAPNVEGASPQRVELPRASTPLEFVLALPVHLSGVVLDPRGGPVPDATVSVSGPWMKTARSDSGGVFRIENAAPGEIALVARAPNWARSETLRLVVASGQSREDLRLVLRTPGRITGVVLDGENRPEAGRPVALNGDSKDQAHRSDTSGRFEFSDLPAGKYTVRTLATEAESAAALPGSKRRQFSEDPLPRFTDVTVEEGASAQVTLRPWAGLENPIVVRGKVRCAGLAIAACGLTAYRTAGGPMVPAESETNADGSFEFRGDGPGSYGIHLHPAFDAPGTSMAIEIPPRKEFEVALELPSGCINGSTVDREGKAVGSVRLELRPESGQAEGTWCTGGYAESDSKGTFRFDYLPAGSYRITAMPSDGRNGKATMDGVVVTEGRALEGLKLVLSPGCRIEGVIRGPAGASAAGAILLVRDPTGECRSSGGIVDAAGKFSIDGLPPGRYSFQAQLGALASTETGAIDIVETAPTSIELQLQASTDLYVQVLDADGKPWPAMLRIFDSVGRDETRSLIDGSDRPLPAQPPPGRRYGPLAPGTYTLECQWGDGRKTTQEVRVSGESTMSLTIRP